jgi:predicted nucleic acid-binding protein
VAEQYKKPYLESSVFIAWIKGESIPQTDADGKVIGHEERANIAKHILSLAEAGQFHVYTSSITITEVHKGNSKAQPGTDPESKTIDFFRNHFFKIVDVDRSIAESAHRLCRKHGLKPYDAVHLACAVRAGCDALLTWDSDLLKITDGGIEISKPQVFGQAVLDLVVQPEAVPPIVTTVVDEGPKITPDGSDGVAEEAAISVQPRREASSSGDTEATPGTVDGQTGNGSSPTATSADVQTPAKEQAPAVAPGSDSDEAESGTSN